MIILQIISMLVLAVIVLLLYYSVVNMISDHRELHSRKEDQDNLDLTNKQ
jgi:uncharacterized membrane protein